MPSVTAPVSSTAAAAQPQSRPRSRRARWLRGLAIAGVVLVLAVVLLWIAIHRIPWLGPAIADGTRAVVGPEPVAWAEDVAYGMQDRINRWRHGDDAPHAYWDVPVHQNPAATTSVEAPSSSAFTAPASFPPKPFKPPHAHVATQADGVWVPVQGRSTKNGSPTMVKSMVHPDHERPYTVLAMVAMDLTRLRVHAAAGTLEPRDPKFPEHMRAGRVPDAHLADVVAAFNGGFQTIHGGYSMMVDGHRIGEPLTDACTVALYPDQRIRIRSWEVLAGETEKMRAYRQTPRCLVERGQRHAELDNPYNTSWGAVVNGGTVIRRSALGISEDGKVLFFGMGDALTARSLADGMRIAGAFDVAQLDVNHVFPRFLLFGDGVDGVEAVEPLCSGFSFSRGDYVKSPMARDFFYVTHQPG